MATKLTEAQLGCTAVVLNQDDERVGCSWEYPCMMCTYDREPQRNILAYLSKYGDAAINLRRHRTALLNAGLVTLARYRDGYCTYRLTPAGRALVGGGE